MKQPVLVILKPDAVSNNIIGDILDKFAKTKLDIVAMRMAKASRELAESHYRHIKGQEFFEDVVSYLQGKFHKNQRLLAIVYYGNNAIKKCRDVAGATDPQKAGSDTVRGEFGRITKTGRFENVVHVSSDSIEAEREIKLWFEPQDIPKRIFPTETVLIEKHKKKVWA